MTKISCETEGHLWGPQGKCVMCDTPKPVEPPTSKNDLYSVADLIDVANNGPSEHERKLARTALRALDAALRGTDETDEEHVCGAQGFGRGPGSEDDFCPKCSPEKTSP